MKRIFAVLAGVFALVYLLNPSFGLFEVIPDTIPGLGNLDEASAAFLLIWAIKQVFGRRDTPKPPEKTVN